jgi:CheY-like chemotaxis protein
MARGYKILIAEDEPDMAVTCARFFRQMGHVPLVALSGTEAIELIEREHPDLVVTDLRLPGVGGLEVVRYARRATPRIPAILVTAHASDGSRRDAHEAGVVACLAKPFSLVDLRVLVERVLSGLAPPAEQP